MSVNGWGTCCWFDVSIGTLVNAELGRAGRDAGQAIGYLSDGHMVAVNGSSLLITNLN